MQWLKGRNVLFGALAVVACSGDPTGNESTPTLIQSDPEVVFVTQGDSQPVIVKVLDEDGHVLQADFTASDVGSGITVRLDPTFQEVTTGNPIRRGSRFFVSGVALTHTNFKVNALGLSKTIEVFVVPGTLDATITDSLPELGDTVTITAPEGTFFTDTSTITFNGAAPVVVSQDESTITFIPLPNTDGPALVSHVGVESNPAVVFDLTTPFPIKTDSIVDIGSAISNPTPALGDPITLTLPAGLKLLPESLVTLNIAGNAVLPRDRTLSADSSVITFVPPPNADSVVTVGGVIPARLAACCAATPGYALLLSTTGKVTTPVVDSFPATVNDANPDANEVVTLTSTDGAFTIDPEATAVIGAAPAFVTARTANSISFTAAPGATGPITVTGVSVAGFALTLPATAGDVTFGTTITPLAGTDAPGTAPSLVSPQIPGGYLLTDAGTFDYAAPIFGGAFGNFPARLYKLTLPADADVTLTLDWVGGAEDLGAYWFEADGTTEPGFDPADNGGEGAHPETATNTVPAGTYLIAVINFSATNPQFSLQVDVAPPSE